MKKGMLSDLSEIWTGLTVHFLAFLFSFRSGHQTYFFPRHMWVILFLLSEVNDSGLDQCLPKLVEHYLSTESKHHLFLGVLKEGQLNIV